MENSGESGTERSGQQVNYTKPATTRLTDQTYERFVQYTEQETCGKSEGLRRLIRSGLDHELDTSEEDPEQTSRSTSNTLLIIGTMLSVGVVGGYASGGNDPQQWVVFLAAGLLASGAYLRLQNDD